MGERGKGLLPAVLAVLLPACGGEVIWDPGGGEEGSDDIVAELLAAPGVVGVTEEASCIEGYRSFLLDFDQPVDHDHPEGQRFLQRLALLHRDTDAPLVLATTGYYLFGEALSEPAELLSANQLLVEERYFEPSRPDPADWSFLDIRQAAADHHAVVEALRPIYDGKWISTGVSKGGMASIYHRRFFPGDVDGTVAYVAPNTLGLDDPRYAAFLARVGTVECRARLEDLQREVLFRREAMIDRMRAEAASEGMSYDLLGADAALEGIVVHLPFSYWQTQGASRCDDVPGAGATDDEVYSFLEDVAPPLFSADPYVLRLEPYRWQAYTQLGTPGVDVSGVEDLLETGTDAHDNLPTIEATPVFDPDAMQDVAAWLSSEGSRVLLIYGEDDPWTAGAFELGGATESWAMVQAGGNHRASLLGLAPADRDVALAALSVWSGVLAWPPDEPPPGPAGPVTAAGGPSCGAPSPRSAGRSSRCGRRGATARSACSRSRPRRARRSATGRRRARGR